LLRPACPAAAALHGQLRPAWSAARVAVLGALQPAGCGRAGRRVRPGRPGRSRAGAAEKPKSFEKKRRRASSRPRPRRDHLRGERDRARAGQAVLRSRRRSLWGGLCAAAAPAV